ncbi:MAG: TetR/AcrR family transcriptional regulator [Hyphomicrobiaceae bacterium]
MADTREKAGTAKAEAAEADEPRGRGRPRCASAHRAILDAAAELLETLDYQDITIERIAAQAKVGKPTIYRWWKTKADLFLEFYREESLRRLPEFDPTDDAITDLEDHLKRLFRIHRSRPVAQGFRALIAEGQIDPAFRENFSERLLSLRRSYLYDIIAHGKKTGQFHKNVDGDLMVDVLLGAFWYRLLAADRKPYNNDYAENIVALVRPYLQTGK